jgi:hypothetical protein
LFKGFIAHLSGKIELFSVLSVDLIRRHTDPFLSIFIISLGWCQQIDFYDFCFDEENNQILFCDRKNKCIQSISQSNYKIKLFKCVKPLNPTIFKHTVSITLINCSLEFNIVTSPLYSLQIKMFPLGEHVKPRGMNGISGRSSLYVKFYFSW